MAKAIFERGEDPFVGKPVTTTPVREVSRAKKSGPGEFTIKAEGKEARAKVVPGADRTTVYKKLGDDEGYPRGYNPQQMREVQEAEDSGNLRIISDSSGKNAANYKQIRKGTTYGRFNSQAEEAKMREVIARSKVNPGETFTDPLVILSTTSLPRGVAGESHPKWKTHPDDGHVIKVENRWVDNKSTYSEPMADATLIHELGHYVDQKDVSKEESVKTVTERSRQRVDGKTIGIAGAEGMGEGIADAYKRENFVPDPRQRNKTRNVHYRALASIRQFFPKDSASHRWSQGYLLGGGEALRPEEWKDPDNHYGTSKSEVPHSWTTYFGDRATDKMPDSFLHPKTGTPVDFGGLINYLRGREDG